jgi:dynein heavy chain
MSAFNQRNRLCTQLCLVSGEIIALSPPMTMMFEVEDLAVASPATVSRCGMIYMEPAALGIRALCVSWLQTLPPSFADFAPVLQELFDQYVPHAVTFVRKQLTETVATVIFALMILSCTFPVRLSDFLDHNSF